MACALTEFERVSAGLVTVAEFSQSLPDQSKGMKQFAC
jgi:hypothetical protein